MASRLRELEWRRFTYERPAAGPEEWRVVFTTPTIAPRRGYMRAFKNKRDFIVGFTDHKTRTIYIDAGLPDEDIYETLHHELEHVPRDADHDYTVDHDLINIASPCVTRALVQMGFLMTQPFPDGFERLRRSSRRYRTRREWE